MQIFISSHLLTVVELKGQSVDGFLVNVSAALIVVNEGNCSGKGDLSAVLDSVEFSYGFSGVSLLEEPIGLPECEDWVLALS